MPIKDVLLLSAAIAITVVAAGYAKEKFLDGKI